MRRGAVVTAATIGVWLAGCALDKPTELGDNATQADVPVVVSESPAPPGPTVLARSDAQASVVASSVPNSSVSNDPDTPVLTGADPADAGPAADTVDTAESVEPTEPARTGDGSASRDDEVRDAKEAAEDAARRILDATLGAANKIKEVGLGAVQSVRESTTRHDNRSEDRPGEELAANGDAETLPE